MTSLHAHTPRAADMRGFRYALEPVVQRHQWELERLQKQLARQQALWQAAQQLQLECQLLYHDQAQALQRKAASLLHPQQHQSTLLYLTRLQAQMVQRTQEISLLQQQRDQLRVQCQRQQHKLDALDDHRGSVIAQFVENQMRAQATEADRDWMMRAVIREGRA